MKFSLGQPLKYYKDNFMHFLYNIMLFVDLKIELNFHENPIFEDEFGKSILLLIC